MAHRLKLILLIFLCAGTAYAQTAIPATPAGRVFAAWLQAFNSGDRAKIDAFLRTYAPRLPQAEFASAQFRGRSGGLNLVAITRGEKCILGFRIQEKTQPTLFYGRIEVTSSKAPTIRTFTLHPVPRGAVFEDVTLDAAMRNQVVESVITKLNELYIYPVVAEKMAASLRAHQGKGDYNAITDGDTFAALLTTHMVNVSHDKHLAVFYQPYKFNGASPPFTFDQVTQDRKAMTRDCGFRKLEILTNNIGYLKVDFFADPMACGRTAAAAMTFLASADAVIFDLRENSGGDPRMVALMCGYLFDRPVHLNNFYDRPANQTTPFWTPRFVPGIRLGQKPAYVLTSGHTFSGAEEFAYDLKNLKRVTVVGETTGGGSHPVSGHDAAQHFVVWVPDARSISPVTGTDWERIGVAPDIRVSADDALETARRLAEEKIEMNAAREAVAAALKSAATASPKMN